MREDVAAALPAMKNEPGDPLRAIGSLTLVRLPDLPDINLRLVSTQVLDQRLVLLDYHVA